MFGLLGGRESGSATARLAVRTARRLDQVDTDELLDRIGSLREEIARVRSELARDTVPDATLGALSSALDHTARLVTGADGRFAHAGRPASAVLARRLA